VFTKILSIDNIDDNKKCFLSTKISILEWFLKDHVNENWSIDAEKPHEVTFFKNIKMQNSYFKM